MGQSLLKEITSEIGHESLERVVMWIMDGVGYEWTEDSKKM